jgi:hypothetical protein
LQEVIFLYRVNESGEKRNRKESERSGGSGGDARSQRNLQNMQHQDEQTAQGKAAGYEAMEQLFVAIGGGTGELELPDSATYERAYHEHTEELAEAVGRQEKIESLGKSQAPVCLDGKQDDERVTQWEGDALRSVERAIGAWCEISCGRIFQMQMNKERGSETKAGTQDGPGKSSEERRRLRIIDLRIESEKGAAVEEEEGEAEEKEDAFEVALAAIAEDNHHPEEHEQGACGETDEAHIEQRGHGLIAKNRPPQKAAAPQMLVFASEQDNGQVQEFSGM